MSNTSLILVASIGIISEICSIKLLKYILITYNENHLEWEDVCSCKPLPQMHPTYAFAPHSQPGCICIKGVGITHVAADCISFTAAFLMKSHRSFIPSRLLFRKKSRTAHLFACKRAHNGSLSLPTFCGPEVAYLNRINKTRPPRVSGDFCYARGWHNGNRSAI